MAKKDDEGKVKFLEVKRVGTTLAFLLSNGDRVEVDMAKLDAKIRELATYHGLNQKIRDAAAGCIKDKDFAGAVEKMTAVVESLYHGDWNRQGGGGQPGIVMEDLAVAIARYKNAPFDKAMTAVRKADADQRKKWAGNATISLYMAEAKVARLQAEAKVATGEELEGLDFDEEDGNT